ncbi:hypothetical protein X772_34655 [Mesorhizobium sp. LSJC280B00]|nr:hypothetical protein X772_34655 [Mesorhizobium sp. LSJC280B00]
MRHLFPPRSKAGQDGKMGDRDFWRLAFRLERAGRNEQVTIEIFMESSKKRSKEIDIAGFQQRGATLSALLGNGRKIGRRYYLTIFKIGDKHCLYEQRLRRIGGKFGRLQEFVGRIQIIEKNLVDTFFWREIIAVVLPKASGFRAIERQSGS